MTEPKPQTIIKTESVNTAFSRDDWRPGEIDRNTGSGVLKVGDVLFGAYEITGKLGEGGMGAVYSARHVSLGSRRAIKVMSASLSENLDAVDRFHREAKALLDVHHPAVVRCHDLLRSEDGCIYLVMELIEGTPLSKRIAERPLSEVEVRELAARIGAGLVAAHAQGVIHRDISPDNVVLPEGRTDQAKLVDFGIAKILRVGEQTVTAGFKGKLAYASPEQLGFFDGEIGPASDFFSLGLLLCGAAMGRRLEMGKNFATAVEARRKPIEIPAAVPANLHAGLHKLLALNPTSRPRSVDGLFDEGATASGTSFPSRRAIGIAAGLLVGIALGGAILQQTTSEIPTSPNEVADVSSPPPTIDIEAFVEPEDTVPAVDPGTHILFEDLRTQLIDARSDSLGVTPRFEVTPNPIPDRATYSLRIQADCECYPLVFFIDANQDSIDLLYPNPNESRGPLAPSQWLTVPSADGLYSFEAEAGTGIDRLKLILIDERVNFPAMADTAWSVPAKADPNDILVSFFDAAGGEAFWSATPGERENLDELAVLLDGLADHRWTSAETILHVLR